VYENKHKRYQFKLDSVQVFALFASFVVVVSVVFALGVVTGQKLVEKAAGTQSSVAMSGTSSGTSTETVAAVNTKPPEEDYLFQDILLQDPHAIGTTASDKAATEAETSQIKTPEVKTPAVATETTSRLETKQPEEKPKKGSMSAVIDHLGSAKQKPILEKGYTVQVSSVNEKYRADTLLSQLTAKGYDAYLQTVELGAKGTWYRVRVGRFAERAEADTASQRMKEDLGIKGLVILFGAE